MKKKIIVSAILIIAIGVGVYYAFFNKTKEEFTIRTDKIGKGDIKVEVTSTGTISAVTTVDVGTQVSGIIKKIFADYNSVVKKGQILAKIDSTNLIKSLQDANINLQRSQVSYDASERNYNRVKALFDKGLESQLNFDNALTSFESAKATLASAKAQLENTKINLDYATIYAPIDGIIIDRKVNPGQTVNAGMSSPTLFQLAYDLSKMQVQATVDEADIGKIDIGQEVTFTCDAFPEDRFTGTIYQIRLAPSVSQNVVNYVVIIDVKNDKLKLMPGMTAAVKIKVAEKLGVLRVPNMALRFNPPKELQDSNKVKELMQQRRGGFGGGQVTGNGQQAQPQQGQPQANAQQQGKPQTQQATAQAPQGNNRQDRQQQGGNRPGAQQGGQQNMTMGQRAQAMGGNMDFAKIQAFRDSLQKAKGGNVSREEIFAAMQKRFGTQFGGGFGGRRDQNQAQGQNNNRMANNQKVQTLPGQARRVQGDAANFGIDQKFEFYRKSSYSPADQFGMGRIWVKNANGLLEPVFVRTGITDGRYTEIYTDKLQEGQEIIVSATSNLSTTTPSAQSASPFNQQQNRQGGPQQMGGGQRGR